MQRLERSLSEERGGFRGHFEAVSSPPGGSLMTILIFVRGGHAEVGVSVGVGVGGD
jgi:hypothetical protein